MSTYEGELGPPPAHQSGTESWQVVVRIGLRIGVAVGILAAVLNPDVRGGFLEALWEVHAGDVAVVVGFGLFLLLCALSLRFIKHMNGRRFQRVVDEHALQERPDTSSEDER